MLTQANIHWWTSHLNLRKFSGLEKEKVRSGPLGSWASFFSLLPEPSRRDVVDIVQDGVGVLDDDLLVGLHGEDGRHIFAALLVQRSPAAPRRRWICR